jgi:chemotaxis protein CheX
MMDMDLEPKEPFGKESRKTMADVTGVIGFTGDRRGTMAFSTSASGAVAIYARLMNEQFNEVTSEIIDAMGELTNIISGQARKELEKESLHLIAHVPMVFVGKDIEISYITKGAVTCIPFQFTIDGKTEEMHVNYVFE